MKKNKLFIVGVFISLTTAYLTHVAKAAGTEPSSNAGNSEKSQKNLPLIFDPQTQKYFIGGDSKLQLRQSESSGPIERIEVSVDGGEYQPYGQSVQFKEEGKHTLKFRAINPVNNWSPVQFVEVFVDLNAPATEAKFSEERYYQDETGLKVGIGSNVTLTSQDNLSGIASVEFAMDGNDFKPYSKPIQIDSPGKHYLVFKATDRVGNVEAFKKIDFTVDDTSPISNLKLEGKNKPIVLKEKTFVSDSVAFAVEASDDSGKVKQTWVNIDGKEQIYIKPIYFLKEGPHTLSYYSVDFVGNKEKPKTFNFNTVSTPPKTMAKASGNIVNTGGINYAKPDFKLELEAKDNIVGLDRVEVKVDNDSDFKTYIEPIRFSVPGLHNISYRAIDRAGNVEPARTYTLFITETPPETNYSAAQPLISRDGVSYSPSPNVFTMNVGNTPVGVKQTLVSINDAPFSPYQSPITLTADKRVHKIMYKSVDKLGNEEKPKTLTVHMIGNTPLVDLFISNNQNAEAQVRTNYLDQPGTNLEGKSDRAPASKENH